MRRLLVVFVAAFSCTGCASKAETKPPVAASDVSNSEREAAAREAIASRSEGPARPRGAAPAPAPPTWRGLNLADAPVTSKMSELPDIWEERPAGSSSYEVRVDVTVIRPHDIRTHGWVYWNKAENRFYVEHDPMYSSTMHFYGPFEGDPNAVLEPPPTEPAAQ